jgi:hypothetical protein
MIATNIESKVRKIIEKNGKGGWLRTSECAKLFAEGNKSAETRFYRWRKKLEKDRDSGFQIVKLPNNISFIGLDSSSPKKLPELEKTRGPNKELEKTKEEKKDLEIRKLRCRMEIRRMERKYSRECQQAYLTDPKKYRARNEPIPFDVQAEIEKKCRKKYGLSTTEAL